MITETVLQGTPREKVGKGPARQLRAAGQIPVTLYGGGKDPISVGINARELAAILRSESGRNSIFTLDVPAGSSPVMIKQLDRDPVTGRILHADFVRISMTETTRVNVRINFVGEPEGVRVSGGMLEVHAHTLEVECLPRDIPESLDIDVSGLDMGVHLRAGDVPLPDGVSLVSDPELLLVSLVGTGGAEAPADTNVQADSPADTDAK
jgi:large subunit ribosomal protein L25